MVIKNTKKLLSKNYYVNNQLIKSKKKLG